MKESQIEHTRVFLGGSDSEDETLYIGIVNGSCHVEQLLHFSHEEGDDRIMFYLNHAVKISNFCSVVITSPDTPHFTPFSSVCLLWFR